MEEKNEKVMCTHESVLEGVKFTDGMLMDIDRLLCIAFHAGNVFFEPRSEAETNPELKQIIPYIIIESNGKIMSYARGRAGGEERLHNYRSIGIGGHINEQDLANAGEFAPKLVYNFGLLRELDEELALDLDDAKPDYDGYIMRPIAAIYDPHDLVGQVHLGFVHWLSLETTNVKSNSESIRNLLFTNMAYLFDCMDTLEGWSRICMGNILDLAVKGKTNAH